jgi:magnesium transporter
MASHPEKPAIAEKHTFAKDAADMLNPVSVTTITDEDASDDILYGLSDEVYDNILDALEDEDDHALDAIIADLDPADIANILEKAPKEKALDFLQHMRGHMDAEVYTYLGYQRLKLLFGALNNREIAAIVADLETDDAIGLLEDFDPAERKDILRYVDQQIRVLVEEGLTYPEASAGRMMQRDYVAVPSFWTVGKTLDYIRALGDELPSQLYDIFVVDPRHHVLGSIPAGQLLRGRRTQNIIDLAMECYTVQVETDREDVATLFKRTILTSVPVIDESDRLIGIITIDDIVTVIDEEGGEDLLRMAGVKEDDFYGNVFTTARARSWWLLINMVTAGIVCTTISAFEGTLEKIVTLAILMPIVASMGGNSGMQTLTVAVRALATRELTGVNTWRVILKEMMIGILNGSQFSLLVGGIVWLVFRDLKLSIVMALALTINLTIAGLIGALIPILLNRLKFDPALGSSIFLTMITDVIGFVSFLGLATLIIL